MSLLEVRVRLSQSKLFILNTYNEDSNIVIAVYSKQRRIERILKDDGISLWSMCVLTLIIDP